MKICTLFAMSILLFALSGCSGSSTGQNAFYHNNQEHRSWVTNPGNKPSNVNPNTGHKQGHLILAIASV